MTIQPTTKVLAFSLEGIGGAEVMKLREVALPPPGPGQALVRLHAAGVNFKDVGQRKGIYPVDFPYTLGQEGSGIVEQIGEGVSEVQVGDRVAFTEVPGSYSQANLVPAAKLILLPPNVDFIQGAAFPLQGMTAHYLLHDFHKIQAGETVLIHAAAGGMGLLLVQWAKHLGAKVLGTVSTEEKAKVAREAGADHVIIYTKEDFAAEVIRLTDGRGADYIIDGVGKSTFTKNLDAVALRGHITIYGAASGPADPLVPNTLMLKSITISGGTLRNFLLTRDELVTRANQVIEGIDAGWLKLRIDHVLPLKEAYKAHELLENRSTVGKVVLRCDL